MRSEPNHVYFRACEGRWSCPFEFEITDRAALAAAPMGRLDRMRVRSLAFWTRRIRRFTFSTRVDYATGGARGEVLHTTRIHGLGLTLLSSRERIVLGDNGRDFTLHGEQWLWPAGCWRGRAFAGRGQVDEAATGAVYELEWFGVSLRQTTIRRADGVDITQESPWSRGTQRLRPAAPTPKPS